MWITPHARCLWCGDAPDTGVVGLGLHDEGTPGGLGGCGDAHRWCVNLTPHPIVIRGVYLPPSGQVARVEEEIEGDGLVVRARPGEITGLPPAQPDGRLFIVSRPVAMAARRADVVAPHDIVRDAAGQPTGARRLVTFA